MEEARGLGREDVVGAAHGPSALAKDGHISRVSSKLADVLLHPNKGLALVPQTLKGKVSAPNEHLCEFIRPDLCNQMIYI